MVAAAAAVTNVKVNSHHGTKTILGYYIEIFHLHSNKIGTVIPQFRRTISFKILIETCWKGLGLL